MLYQINNKDEDKLEEFLNKENIEYESYYSWYDNFVKEESEFQLNDINNERYCKLSKKHQKECMESLINEIYRNEYVIDSELISYLVDEVLEFYEDLEKKKKKKSKDKKKDKIRHVKVKRIK